MAALRDQLLAKCILIELRPRPRKVTEFSADANRLRGCAANCAIERRTRELISFARAPAGL